MKLRVRGNSVRLRLSPSEVARLIERGAVAESTNFGGGSRLGYELRVSSDVAEPRATFETAQLLVTLPAAAATHWATSDEVGISAQQPTGDGATLRLLIEKDFECLDRAAGDEEEPEEAYPHPARQSGGGCGPVV